MSLSGIKHPWEPGVGGALRYRAPEFKGLSMKYRKAICKKNGRNDVAIPSTLTEAVNLTLCNKSDEHSYNNLKCLNRECNECGVDTFVLLPEEVSVNNDEQVVWKHYAYVGTGKFLSNGQEKKLPLETQQSALPILPPRGV